jgi:hypothetical protein
MTTIAVPATTNAKRAITNQSRRESFSIFPTLKGPPQLAASFIRSASKQIPDDRERRDQQHAHDGAAADRVHRNESITRFIAGCFDPVW